MKKVIISFIALVISGIAMCAEPVAIGDLKYILTSSTMTAEVYEAVASVSGEVVIPATVEYNSVTYTVTSIGTRAFMYESGLTGVTFPNTLEKIGNQAFAGCNKLTELVFPASLKELGSSAFQGDDKIAKVKCYAVEPPVYGDYAFVIHQDLYVPKGSIDKYEDAEGWGNFINYYEIDDTAIESLKDESRKSTVESKKLIRNGQVLIVREGKLFNLLGAEVR